MTIKKGSAGITQREFARLDGCDEKRVRMAISTGHLKKLANNRLNPALVGTGWRKRNRKGADSAATKPTAKKTSAASKSSKAKTNAPAANKNATTKDVSSIADKALQQLQDMTQLWSIADAEKVKENYLALHRKLKYDLESGAVVPVDEVAALFGAGCAKIRTRLLSLPSELAPRVKLMKTAPEIEAAIREGISEALEELTGDRANAIA